MMEISRQKLNEIMIRARCVMAEKDIKGKEIAATVGVSPQALSMYLKCKRKASHDTVMAIVNYLDMDIEHDATNVTKDDEEYSKLTDRQLFATKKIEEATPDETEIIINVLEAILKNKPQ